MLRKGNIRALCVLLACVVFMLALPGCASSDWGGEWNRTGDKSYSRAVINIKKVSGKGFSFDAQLYGGNLAGELRDMQALFLDRSKKTAQCDIDDSDAYIYFEMTEGGSLNVVFYSSTTVETELFGFSARAFITGNYEKGEVEYQNESLYAIGMLTRDEDALVRAQLSDSAYLRLLDCFQSWFCGTEDEQNPGVGDGEHDDELGAYIYYGSNIMQRYAAVVIIYDDGSVGVVLSQINGSLLYFSDNRIYGSGEVTPLPVSRWITKYNAERNS